MSEPTVLSLAGKSDDELAAILGAEELDYLYDELVRSLAGRIMVPPGPAVDLEVTTFFRAATVGRSVEVSEAGATVAPLVEGHDPAALLEWETLSDLISVEAGQRLYMSMLRAGRAVLSADDYDTTLALASVRSAPTDSDGPSDEFCAFALLHHADEPAAVEAALQSIGLDRVMRWYVRSHAEALDMSDIRAEIASLSWGHAVVDRDGTVYSYTALLGPDDVKVVPDAPAEATIRWLTVESFARYLARQLDFREAIGREMCQVDGDRALIASVYSRVGRHPL